MKSLLSILILLLVGCLSASGTWTDNEGYVRAGVRVPIGSATQKKQSPDDKDENILKYGAVYKGMPREDLEEAGYTKRILIYHDRQGREEYMCFSDWLTPQYGDTVTFYILDGKVEDWFRDVENQEHTDGEM